MSRRLAWASVVWLGCKYGGSDEDPLAGYEPEPAIEIVAIDAASPQDPPSSRQRDGSGPSSTLQTDADKPPSNASACEPATPAAVCDPVRNTGCPPIPLMQCDADPGAAVATGRCSIFTPTPIVPCSSTTTATSTACPPQTSCVNNECRKLCYCDSDCDPGQTCSELAGAFKLCR